MHRVRARRPACLITPLRCCDALSAIALKPRALRASLPPMTSFLLRAIALASALPFLPPPFDICLPPKGHRCGLRCLHLLAPSESPSPAPRRAAPLVRFSRGDRLVDQWSETAYLMANTQVKRRCLPLAPATADTASADATDYKEDCSLLWVQIDQKHGIPPTVPYSQYKALANQWGEWRRANFATAAVELLTRLRGSSSERVVRRLDPDSANGSRETDTKPEVRPTEGADSAATRVHHQRPRGSPAGGSPGRSLKSPERSLRSPRRRPISAVVHI